MANYCGTVLSTSFRVKDHEVFLADPEVQRFISHVESEQGFFERDGEYWAFGWEAINPDLIIYSSDPDSETEEVEVNVCEVIRRHIVDDDVCEIRASGNEKLRYNGGSLAFVSAKAVIEIEAVTGHPGKLTVDGVRQTLSEYARAAEAL
jgi:hypothetical protein